MSAIATVNPQPAGAAPSDRKLAANRANAQLSTGPKTAEGKAKSSANALRHGLSAREVVVAPEERARFDEFLADYQASLLPEGALETDLFSAIVHAAWNLRRIRILEAQIAPTDADFLLDEQIEAKLDRLARYYKRFESTLLRCTRELRAIQSNRAAAILFNGVRETAPLANPAFIKRAERTHYQAETDSVRAAIAKFELETAARMGRVPQAPFTSDIPRMPR